MTSRRDVVRSGAVGLVGLAVSDPLFAQRTESAPPRASALAGLTVTDLRTYVLPKAILVEVIASNGMSGWGESSPNSKDLVATFIRTALRAQVVGRRVWDAEPIWDDMFFTQLDLGPSGVLPYAIAGIDVAMWDLRGKATGLPVHKLLGGQWRDDVRAYGSFGVDAGRKMTAVQAAQRAARFVERGFTAVKLRMQLRERDVDPDPDPTFAYAKAVRQAIGENIELIIDINGGYTPARAIQMGKRLAGELGVRYFEEPVSSMTPGALRQVVEALDLYIISGEKEYTRWQHRDVMDLAGVDLLNPDVIKCGGLTEAKKIAALAQATSRRIVPHNTRPTLGTAATLHFAASISNLGPFMEFPDVDEFTDLLAIIPQGGVLRDGKLVVPSTPGLGVPIDRARVLKAVVS